MAGTGTKEAQSPVPEEAVQSAVSSPPQSPPRSGTTATTTAIQPATNLPLQEDDGGDGDSAYDGDSHLLSTASLSSSIFQYRQLHGRTYQNSARFDQYWGPNDDQQNEGLDMMHTALVRMMDDKLYLAPIGDHPERVLDLGTGTGIWALDFADEHPGTEVIGTDISPIQPSWLPPNLSFQIDDMVLDWTWPENHFDFIHLRFLYGSVPDWKAMYAKVFKHLKPGGWIQHCEQRCGIETDHFEIKPDHTIRVWEETAYECGRKMGRPLDLAVGHKMKDGIEAAGFVKVVENKLKVPTSTWPQDKTLKEVGALVLSAADTSLEGYSLLVFMEVLGWSKEEALLLTAQFRKHLRDKSLFGYCPTTVVYGQKPLV